MFTQVRKRRRLAESWDQPTQSSQLAQPLAASLSSTPTSTEREAPGPELSHFISKSIHCQLQSSAVPTSSSMLRRSKGVFSCRVCSIELSSSSNRLRHERAKHPKFIAHTGERAKGSAVPLSATVPGEASATAAATAAAAAACRVTLHRAPQLHLTAELYTPCRIGEDEYCEVDRIPRAEAEIQPAQEPMKSGLQDLTETSSLPDQSERVAAAACAATMPIDPETSPYRVNRSEEVGEQHQLTAAASAAAAPAASSERCSSEELRPLLREEQLQSACYPFLCWLTQPAVTSCEALVKARRVKSATQLQPIKCNLRFIFTLLYEKRVIHTIDVQQFADLAICQALFNALAERAAGSARIHAIFLLVKKLLVYLSSRESSLRRQFIQPTVYSSFVYVDQVCSDSSFRRKQETRNRAMLGAHASQLLAKAQQQQVSVPFEVPTSWSTPALAPSCSPAHAIHSDDTKKPSLPQLQSPAQARGGATAAAAAGVTPSNNELTKAELKRVAEACMSYLQLQLPESSPLHPLEIVTEPAGASAASHQPTSERISSLARVNSELCCRDAAAASHPHTEAAQLLCCSSTGSEGANSSESSNDTSPAASQAEARLRTPRTAETGIACDEHLFMAYLVTATLCLGLAPRSQVLKQLQLGSSFVKQESDGRYWVKLLADMSKNGKPTTFALPHQLTAPFDFYLSSIRPRLLQKQREQHSYVFVKHNGSAPRSEFSSCTALITQRIIGRAVNAHAFRGAVITTFYEAGASQGEMDMLARIMAHDPATAKSFYHRPQFETAAVQSSERMLQCFNMREQHDASFSM